jgi:hypothetical protein
MIRSNSAVTGSQAITLGLETVLGLQIDELHLMKTSFSTRIQQAVQAFVWIAAWVDQLRSAEAVVRTKEKILCAISWMVDNSDHKSTSRYEPS